MPLLEVRDLAVSFATADGDVQAVRGLSFGVSRGQTFGLVGESGSGKSVATQTIVGLTQGARISGRASFEGRDLLRMDAEELRRLRGAGIALIFQDPLSSLHPHYRIGWQIVEAIRAHESIPKRTAERRAVELLRRVGIPQPERRVEDYPHQFSGGMRQRVMIAMALALNPKLLIADEPTTALDVTVQAQIIELMKALQVEYGMAIILITHDLSVVAGIADDVLVMYAGRAMEHGDRRSIYRRPASSVYGRAAPGAAEQDRREGSADPDPRATAEPHQPPGGLSVPSALSLRDRTLPPETPPLQRVVGAGGHVSACWLPPDRVSLQAQAARAAP